ncbi:GNAT family N-acetyltransferase [Jiangella alkaliphila]|uniref:Protein N-acetyltransferase, RimJ/RimL family n=1 Tax=Jiangella alkaliphila TaxID=419479 RepID=A0A1H2LYV0_9ACTN|nr:GNAT family N-acetyltransferase [Jiangella alkaliphila]SDU86032.1 Protein N-acetyltransferase, RimJ/RimL family [Jiangella alkaliphila]
MTYRPLASELETERLSLRPLVPADAAEWHLELLGEREDGTTRTLDEDRRLLADLLASEAANGIGFRTIRRRSDGEPLGYTGLLIGRASLDEPELAYELLRRHHGQGYATEAARAVVDAAAATGRTRLWSTVGPWNTPSFRVLEKLGFRRDRVGADERSEFVYLVRDLP